MKKRRDIRIMSLVHKCTGIDVEDRTRYLDAECNGDAALRREVEEILDDGTSPTGEFSTNEFERALPGHYRLMGMIGAGGMAKVFMAEDTRLGRRVAIKFLNDEFRREPERMRRFNQEARAASALNHPNIITIYDIGEADGLQFIVSEFVDGETLGSRIERGPLPLKETLDIAIQIASALKASHKAGIVHRDLKPDNIMLTPEGNVKVLDFGLAKETGSPVFRASDSDARTLAIVTTSPGMILGTPQYMSPEQIRGSQLDARSDVFSLGIVIFEMIAGKPPFAGSTVADMIAAIIGNEPLQIEDHVYDPPAEIVRIVEKALRKDREERYSSVEHLLSDLRDLRHEIGSPASVGFETRRAAAHRTLSETAPTRRLSSWTWLISISGIAAVVSFAWWFNSGLNSDRITSDGPMRSVPITSWSSGVGELVSAASFSPDGRMVAFAASKRGATEIWIKPTIGGEPLQITKNGFYNQYPIWSPDGQEIAFFSNRGGTLGLWRISFTGGGQTQIMGGAGSNAKPLLWAASGKIYFQQGPEAFALNVKSGDKQQITDFAAAGIKPREIEVSSDELKVAYVVDEPDAWKLKIKTLGRAGDDEIAASQEQVDEVAWHPHGQTVFFSGSIDGSYQVFEARADGSGAAQLSNGNTDFYVQDVSSDGSKILYTSVNETSDLWKLDVVDGRASLVANDVASEFWADFSPDARAIVFQSVTQTDRPYSGSIQLRNPTDNFPLAPEGFSPVFSPDGKWVAYFKRSQGKIELWVVRPTGDGAQRIADGDIATAGYAATPYLKLKPNQLVWSADGTAITYSSSVNGISNIWKVGVDGGRTLQLTSNTNASVSYCCAVWTLDARSLVFSSEYRSSGIPAKFAIIVRDIAASEERILFETTHPFRMLGLGENGTDIVYIQRADPKDSTATPESTNVYSLSIESGVISQINVLTKAFFNNVHISRDGRSMAYVARDGDTTTIWAVRASGGPSKDILVENDPKNLINSLGWSQDGRQLVFGKQTRTHLISMLSK